MARATHSPSGFPGAAALLLAALLLAPAAVPAFAQDLSAPLLPQPAAPGSGAVAPSDRAFIDHVVVVLDASGSMDGTMAGGVRRIDAAKAALAEVLGRIPQTTHVGLLVFSASNLSDDWAYPLGPRDDAALRAAIERPAPGGGTPLGAYIKKGADRLLEARAKGFGYGSYRLLVVTDGEAHDAALVDRYVPDIMSRGITIDAIGVDMKGDHTLARRVHSYRRADDPASLSRALAEVFAEVSSQGAGAVAAEEFALLAPLPAEAAGAMLKALSASGNHPIGDEPGGAGGPAGDPSAAAAPAAPGGGDSTATVVLLFVFFVIAVNAFEKIGRALRGKR